MGRSVPGENSKAAPKAEAKWGTRREWEVNEGGGGGRHAGDRPRGHCKDAGSDLSREETIWLSFSKEGHCLPHGKEVIGSRPEAGRPVPRVHLSHVRMLIQLSRPAGAGEDGGQRASDPTHRSTVPRSSPEHQQSPRKVTVSSCSKTKRKTSRLSKVG